MMPHYVTCAIRLCRSLALGLALSICIAAPANAQFDDAGGMRGTTTGTGIQGSGGASKFATAAEAKAQATSTFDKIQGSIQGVKGGLEDTGKKLFAALFLLTFTWKMGELMLEGGDFTNTLGGVIRTVFLGALTYWFLTPYSGPFGDGKSLPLVWFLDQMGASVSSSILGGGEGKLGDVAGAAFGNFYEAMDKIGWIIAKTFAEPNTWMGQVAAFFTYLVPILYLGVAAAVMWVGGIAFFVMATIGLLMFQIGAMLAPIFIPWIVFGAASWLFDGWLKFMISATMYKIAGAAIIALGNAVIGSAMKSILDQPWASVGLGEAGSITLSAMLVAAVAVALAYLMLTLPTIAQGLISGSASVSMQRLMTSLGKAGQQTTGAAASAAGRGLTAAGNAGTHVKNAAAAVQSGWQSTKATAGAAAKATRTAALAAGLAHATGGMKGVAGLAGAAAKSAAGGAAKAAGSGLMSAGKAAGGMARSAGGGLQSAGRNLVFNGTSSPAMKSIRSPSRGGPKKP